MKTLFVIILILSTFAVSAQSMKIYNLDSIKRVPKTQIELANNAIKTESFAIYKEIKYPVYKTANSKLFIIVQSLISKNWYRKYIKQD